MEVVHDAEELQTYLKQAAAVIADAPVLLDCFLSNAIEIDVDAVCDGQAVLKSN